MTSRATRGFRLGLTGTFGSGKSTVAGLIAAAGVPVIDADALSRAVVEPGQPALAEIAQAFGADLIGADGRLDRRTLAQRAFVSRDSAARLTAIIHPRVRAAELRMMDELAAEPLLLLDIPLLFEVGAQEWMDRIAVVTVSERRRFARLKGRGYSEREVIARLGHQWPQSRKTALATDVIDNDGPLEATRSQIQKLLDQIRGETKHA